MPKVTPYSGKDVITVGHRTDPDPKANSRWWLLNDKAQLAGSLFAVVKYLKDNQNWRQNQAALFSRLYGNMPVWNQMGMGLNKISVQHKFPSDRPTMNVIQSCVDGLVSRLVQSKPKPMFITQGGDYKKRRLSKQLNKFIDGEFYSCKVYELGEQVLRDAIILGDGVVKVYESDENKVRCERVLPTEIFVDESDGRYGFPQQMHQLKIVDRDVMAEMFSDYKGQVMSASAAYFDASAESQNTISSQIMVCESWHLPSGKESKDGRHIIAIDHCVLLDEEWDKPYFPFVFFKFAPRVAGFWAQGLAEQLMGIQNEINRLLYTIQTSLHLCGIPKWLVEDGSKVVTSHINNQIGGIIKYQGTPPSLQVANCLPAELYNQLNWLIEKAYQQSGVSMLTAASQKPAGLNSGIALREYDDLQSDRFAFLSQRYEKFYLELARVMFDFAKVIAERDGKYETIYPGKKSLLSIDFPKEDLGEDEFVIQAYPTSALSKQPAQRKQEIIDLMQAGLIDPIEGRRLLDYPDIQQEEDLLNAAEERILKALDSIVEDGEYTPPDPFMDLSLAKKLVVQYYNKYAAEELEEEKAQMLRDFSVQIDTEIAAATPQQPQPVATPQAVPEPTPQSQLIPNVA
jgi:hypothetical protein